jgi:outer membrane protein OmpA-like peptidoglycan-associated protein
MKTIQFLCLVTVVALFSGCAAVTPNELINARSAYEHASAGPAAQLAPAELHKAHEALLLAEASFQENHDSYETRDLAYAAQRKSELAGAFGAMAADKASKVKADADFDKKQAEIVKQGKQDLRDSEQRTADAQADLAALVAVNESEKRAADAEAELAKLAAVQESERRTADALAELAKLAAVREEERGLVVTLSGSVLFRSAESNLLPSAQVKLDQVANALLAVRERSILVEGHTDSQGSESYNQGLSQRRADAVRDYIVQRGYPADHIQARGKGEGSPIADNASPEGRANNRRVEIVIERDSYTPNPSYTSNR